MIIVSAAIGIITDDDDEDSVVTHSGNICCSNSSVLRFSSRSWSVRSSTISSRFLEYFSIIASMLSNMLVFLKNYANCIRSNETMLQYINEKEFRYVLRNTTTSEELNPLCPKTDIKMHDIRCISVREYVSVFVLI